MVFSLQHKSGDWLWTEGASQGKPVTSFLANLQYESSQTFDPLLRSRIHSIINFIAGYVLSLGLGFAFFLGPLLFYC